MWEGFTVEAGGSVLRWSGFIEGDDEQPAGTLSEAQMAEIWQRLSHDDLLNLDLSETGNMTAFIEVSAEGETRRLSWEVGTETDNDSASAADAAYRDIRDMIEAGVAGARP